VIHEAANSNRACRHQAAIYEEAADYCQKPVTIDRTKQADVLEVQREVKGNIKKEVMYSCPHCNAVLGFGSYFGGWLTGRP
jgi:hypothetical protein